MGSCVKLLSFFLFFISQTVRTRHEDLPCPLSLTVPLEKDKVHRYENGSLFHEGTLYPTNLYWTKNDSVRGCICELRPCLRKCCQDGEVLSDGETPNCTKLQNHDVLPDLRLKKDQLTSEIQNIRSIANHFAILRNKICHNNKTYILDPEKYEEDKITIEANGILKNEENIYPQWMYCIDWDQSLKKIIVLICFQQEEELPLLTTQIYPIMTIVSIPFLIITFLVYAIIPELRNIYGKTLMCYVACLTISYCFLINSQFKYLPRNICIPVESTTDEEALIPRQNTEEDYIRYCVPEGNCLSFCCPPGFYTLPKNKCERIKNTSIPLPRVYAMDLSPMNVTTNDKNFYFLYWNPCIGAVKIPLNPAIYPEEQFFLLQNGSFYLPFSEKGKQILNPRQYCLSVIKSVVLKEYLVIYCDKEEIKEKSVIRGILISLGMIVSIPFLLATWLVYTLIKELRNLHGFVLRAYIASLTISYTILSTVQIAPQEWISNVCCVFLAFFMYFFFLASFYWLNVMCFDIWWTFGGFRALRGSMQQRDRKKFIIYSIYAWGMALFFTGICLIMDFAPNIPESSIRPQLGAERCWFKYNTATNIYFIGPMTISVFCNLCLFISTALKIQKHKRDTAHHLRGSESRRHDDNKQWFNLYLKLFIVMGITWSTEIISTLWKESDNYIWYVTDVVNTLQGLIIFITLVCKEKIKRLLLKRFGYNDNKFLSRNSTRSVYHSSASRTTCTTVTSLPLQDKVNANIRHEAFGTSKESAEESDCP
ncbi:G-protein coupled receptor Mth2-like isoform X1 [Vespa crabro]|uniref:G-protein coupled receptor Mth2-like isoform X1 n=1 Tax=Vespa crabro TaxID=7445 RepID=UPI001F0171A1|nr:G-protein coupled receptor Mth2-like isoform X1 [Vespa crabro]